MTAVAVPPNMSHPEWVWTLSVSVVNTGSDISLIDRAQVPASTTVDKKTRWMMTWIEEQTKTIPTVELQVTTPWGTQPHRLGMVNKIRHGVESLLG